MAENHQFSNIKEIKETLERDLCHFNAYLDDCKRHKMKALNPLNQGKIMASAGVVAYINELLKGMEDY